MTSRIAVVLPPREGFEPHAAGAVALCVADFARHTRDDTTIYGTKGEGFPGLRYHRLDAKRPFHRSHGAHYLRQLARALEAERPALVEIHNRPALALALARCWPVALHLHNDPQAMRGAATLAERRRLLARLRGVHAVSGFVAGRFLDGLPDPAGKVAVTPNGLALPDTLPEKQPIILYAGRLR